jgi:hypothetical protein
VGRVLAFEEGVVTAEVSHLVLDISLFGLALLLEASGSGRVNVVSDRVLAEGPVRYGLNSDGRVPFEVSLLALGAGLLVELGTRSIVKDKSENNLVSVVAGGVLGIILEKEGRTVVPHVHVLEVRTVLGKLNLVVYIDDLGSAVKVNAVHTSLHVNDTTVVIVGASYGEWAVLRAGGLDLFTLKSPGLDSGALFSPILLGCYLFTIVLEVTEIVLADDTLLQLVG